MQCGARWSHRKSGVDAHSFFRDRKRPQEFPCAPRAHDPNEPPSRTEQRQRQAAALKSAEVERDEPESRLPAGASQLFTQRICYYSLEHLWWDLESDNGFVPTCPCRPNVARAKKLLHRFDLCQPLRRH